ncbi:hypothetical protein [Schlesneria sp. DSM 10557]|uniref:hypothetical protein n=1 Tax=Schlesneria sp. DSM 10557 TaxID=3044399 RepID=UPI00359FD233
MSESDQTTIRMPVSKSSKSDIPAVRSSSHRKKGKRPWRVAMGIVGLVVFVAGAWGATHLWSAAALVESNDSIADLDDMNFGSPGFNNPKRFEVQLASSKKPSRGGAKRKSGQETAESSGSNVQKRSFSGVWLIGKIEPMESNSDSTVPEQIADKPDASVQR